MRLRRYIFALILLLAGILLVGCQAAPTEAPVVTDEPVDVPADVPADEPEDVPTDEPEDVMPAEPKILTVRLRFDIETLDFGYAWGIENNVSGNIHEGLVMYKDTWDSYVDMLATSLEGSDDGLEISFTLREGVLFQKGYGELTAEDVKFSFERMLDTGYGFDWGGLESVEVTGTYSGIIHLSESNAALFVNTLPASSGWIVSKAYFDEIGEEAYALNPLGTGPYEFVEWVPNERVVLKRFEGYWGEAPIWDEIHFLPIIDASVAEIALEAGDVDFGHIDPASVDRFEASDDFEVYKIETPNYYWLSMNLQHPNLADINVRLAIRYAVDVPSILEGAWDNKWPRACSLIAPGILGHWEDAPCYNRDLEKARDYMAAAGLETLDLVYHVKNTETDIIVAEIIQAQLAEIGINVELVIQDAAIWGETIYGATAMETVQLSGVYYSTYPDPSWSTIWFLEDWGPSPMFDYPEEFETLHFEAVQELDPSVRAEKYLRMQEIWDEAVHTVWIGYPAEYYVARAGLTPVVTRSTLMYPRWFTESE